VRFFHASRLVFLAFRVRDAARTGHSWLGFLESHVPGPRPGCYRDLAGHRFRARRRSWDSLRPFAVFIRLKGGANASSAAPGPPAVSRRPPAASFIVAGPCRLGPAKSVRAAATGLRGSLKSAVPSRPPTPPWLLCTGSHANSPARTALGFVVLSQVFGHAPPASTSGDPSARASPSADRDVAAAMNVTTGERALRRCTRGRRLADPGVVPARAGVPV